MKQMTLSKDQMKAAWADRAITFVPDELPPQIQRDYAVLQGTWKATQDAKEVLLANLKSAWPEDLGTDVLLVSFNFGKVKVLRLTAAEAGVKTAPKPVAGMQAGTSFHWRNPATQSPAKPARKAKGK